MCSVYAREIECNSKKGFVFKVSLSPFQVSQLYVPVKLCPHGLNRDWAQPAQKKQRSLWRHNLSYLRAAHH